MKSTKIVKIYVNYVDKIRNQTDITVTMGFDRKYA